MVRTVGDQDEYDKNNDKSDKNQRIPSFNISILSYVRVG